MVINGKIKNLLLISIVILTFCIPNIVLADGGENGEPGASCAIEGDYQYSVPPYVGTLNFKESEFGTHAEVYGTVYRTGNQKDCAVVISENYPLLISLEGILFTDLKSVYLQGYCDTEMFEPDPGGCDDYGTRFLELVAVGSMSWWPDMTGFTANVTLKGVKVKLQ